MCQRSIDQRKSAWWMAEAILLSQNKKKRQRNPTDWPNEMMMWHLQKKCQHFFQVYEAIIYPNRILTANGQLVSNLGLCVAFFPLTKPGLDSLGIGAIPEKLFRSATFQRHVWKCCFSMAFIDLTTVISPQSPIRAKWLESLFLAVGCHQFAAPFLLTWFVM